MKRVRVLGVVAFTAMLAMSIVGAGTASATASLCKENVEICSEESRWGAVEVVVEHDNTQPQVLTGGEFFELTCKYARLKGEITSPQGEPYVVGRIVSAEWSECSLPNGTQCLVTALQLPWEVHLEQGATQDGNGVLWVGPGENKPANGQPGVEVGSIPGGGTCFWFGDKCIFKTQEDRDGSGEVYGSEWVQAGFVGGESPTTNVTKPRSRRRKVAVPTVLRPHNPTGQRHSTFRPRFPAG